MKNSRSHEFDGNIENVVPLKQVCIPKPKVYCELIIKFNISFF